MSDNDSVKPCVTIEDVLSEIVKEALTIDNCDCELVNILELYILKVGASEKAVALALKEIHTLAEIRAGENTTDA